MPQPDTAPATAMLSIDSVHESPTNPRKYFDEASIAELAESIKEKGVLQPVLVRSRPRGLGDAYELVFGHRRLRAARAAGLTEIPAMVRELDDRQVLEYQVVENCQRQDVSPMEEANGYRRLHTEHGYSVEEISSKVGKSKSYVYQRMQLAELPDEAREALEKGELAISVGIALARIPDAAARLQATEAVLEEERTSHWDEQGRSYVEVKERKSTAAALALIKRKYSTRFDGCGFPLDDAGLVLKAGSCASCSKRTCNAQLLFADMANEDLCLDPSCFEAKKSAAWERTKAEAESKGLKVLDGKESEHLFYGSSLSSSSGYVDLAGKCPEDPKSRPWKRLLGKAAPAPVIARDGTGKVHELLPKKEAERLLRESDKAPPEVKSRAEESAKWQDDAERQKKKRKVDLVASQLALEQVVQKVVAAGLDTAALRVLARLACPKYSQKEWLKRRAKQLEVAAKTSTDLDAFTDKLIAELDQAGLQGFIVEALVGQRLSEYEPNPPELGFLCAAVGVNRQAIVKKVAAEEKAKGKDKSGGKKAGGKSSKKKDAAAEGEVADGD